MKPGSKRRRTAVELEAQLSYEAAEKADLHASKVKLDESHQHIQIIERQLNELDNEANENKGAAQMLQ